MNIKMESQIFLRNQFGKLALSTLSDLYNNGEGIREYFNMRKDTKYLFVNEKKLQWDNYNKKTPCKTGLVKY